MDLQTGTASRFRRYAFTPKGIGLLEHFGRVGPAAARDRWLIATSARLQPRRGDPVAVRMVRALDLVGREFGDIDGALILRTDWYKDSLGAGFLRLAKGDLRFVKIFRTAAEALQQRQLVEVLQGTLPADLHVPPGVEVVGSTFLTDAVEGAKPATEQETTRYARHLGSCSRRTGTMDSWDWCYGASSEAVRKVVALVVGDGHADETLRQAAGLAGIPLARAHGDFVPWNVLNAQGTHYLIDFEESGQLPEYFDLAHSIIQPAALAGEVAARPLMDEFRTLHDQESTNTRVVAAILVEVSRCVRSWQRFPKNRRMIRRMLQVHVETLAELTRGER